MFLDISIQRTDADTGPVATALHRIDKPAVRGMRGNGTRARRQLRKEEGMSEETATAKQVAAYLHTSESGLAMMRYRGTGPKFVKVGPRKVIYRWADVEAYLSENTCTRTDDPRGAA